MEDDQLLVRRLVQDVLESGRAVEDVCSSHPDRMAEVQRLWQRARALEDRFDAIFPSPTGHSGQPAPITLDLSIPQIPGYDFLGVLGHGGMGVVYKARHISLNRTVAVKVPLAGAFASASERQRLVREACAVAALDHPNIITVYDVGQFEGRPYFTMEFVDGLNLGAKLANTPQPVRECAAVVATLAEAIDVAHQAGIIHRDLKPANVLLAPDGTLKITDFGLARQFGGDATLTAAGFHFGTPSYMSPEQASGRPSTSNSSVDIYSLGAILYEMLTGRPPFRGENAVETVRQVLEEDPAPPSRLNPRVPRDLETICLVCLRKEPQRRYVSAAALAGDLRRFIKGEPIQARPVGPLERLYRRARRNPAHAALVGAGVCVLLAALAVGFWMQHVQNARAAEATLRQGRARQAIETAVLLTSELRASERWIEARHVLEDAYPYVTEANSDDLARTLNEASRQLTAAYELDDIRRSYPECSDTGYNYRPASEAYTRIFARLGLGPDVPLQTAAEVVKSSPIRKELLAALDNAAFVARVNTWRGEVDRLLTIARTADPDPWRDRFRQPAAWYDRDTLLALYQGARTSTEPPPSHQLVIVGVLLSGFGANDKTIEILREARKLNPVDFWVNLELGNSLARAGKPADATQYFRAAVTIQPKNPAPWVTLATQLNQSGLREEALIAIRQAAELNPRLLPVWRTYVHFLRSAGRLDEAETVLSHAVEKTPNLRLALEELRTGVSWDRARRSASQGEWRQALSEYTSMLPSGPSDGEFWFELAAVSLIAGDRDVFERSRTSMMTWSGPGTLRPFLVTRAVTLTPAPEDLVRTAAARCEPELLRESSTYWALRERGAIMCRTGRYADAIPFLEQSLASKPSTGRAVLSWLWLAIAYHHLGNAAESARWHAAAVAWLDTLPKEMPDKSLASGLHLHDWLEARLLRQEADLLLSSPKEDR